MSSSVEYNSAPAAGLPRRTLLLMALACGVCVANICYNQPLLGDFSAHFNATAAQAGWVAMASQAGYGLGLLFFLPLGDKMERAKLVRSMIWLCAGLLVFTAAAPTLPLLIVGNLLVGATAVGAQVLIPLAVELSPPEQRGQTVGTLMTGLLGGILLARTLAGFIADAFGWRMVFAVAAAMMVALALLLRGRLPTRAPTVDLSYRRLIASLWQVWRTQPKLWRSSFVGALSFASFTAFWTSLSFLMAEKFHRGATETGLFGIVGLGGALLAPYAGRLADRRGSVFAVSLALAASIAAFALMELWVAIPALVLGVLLMDVGVQTTQVAEQGNVLMLLPEARSRLNTLYMVVRFAGGALGSLAGAYAWSLGRWPAVCAVAIALNAAALLLHLVAHRQSVIAVLGPRSLQQPESA